MKIALQLSEFEQQLLNQRNIIEIIDHLKYHGPAWHTRHPSIINALRHLIADKNFSFKIIGGNSKL